MTNLYPPLTQGDVVILTRVPRASGTNGLPLADLDLTVPYPVTRVSTNYLWVRIPSRYGGELTTVQLHRAYFEGNPNGWDPMYHLAEGYVPPRKRGTTPDDIPGAIGIDHPGIQWLWDDLAAYATQQSWCPQYDALAAAIGIPGRRKKFKVSREVADGFRIEGSIEARSQAEADTLFNTQLAGVTL